MTRMGATHFSETVSTTVSDPIVSGPIVSDPMVSDPIDDANPVGRPPVVTDDYLERLQRLVQTSPKTWGYSFRRWTAQKLKIHLARETGVDISARHVNRLLKKLGLSTRLQPSGVSGQSAGEVSARRQVTCRAPQPKSDILIDDIMPSTSPDFVWEMELATETGLNLTQPLGDVSP